MKKINVEVCLTNSQDLEKFLDKFTSYIDELEKRLFTEIDYEIDIEFVV